MKTKKVKKDLRYATVHVKKHVVDKAKTCNHLMMMMKLCITLLKFLSNMLKNSTYAPQHPLDQMNTEYDKRDTSQINTS